MKILMSCRHNYPAYKPIGTGMHVSELPSGSGMHIHDLLVKGLAELGHEVYYHLPNGYSIPLPEGVIPVSHLPTDVDICHTMARVHTEVSSFYQQLGTAVLATNHLYLDDDTPCFTWVHVSKYLAEKYHSDHYVSCGLDPDDFVYSEEKEEYLLFISDLSRYKEKGLERALDLSKKAGQKLIVAGTSKFQKDIEEVKQLCQTYGAIYIGDVRGREKANWIAKAKALLSPSTQDESFGLTLVEAMFSGTPSIVSNVGAYSEVLCRKTGIICETDEDFLVAFECVTSLSSKECRNRALRHFHYIRMVQDYIRLYTQELKKTHNSQCTVNPVWTN